MTTRLTTTIFALLLLTFSSVGKDERPNVLFISVDDMNDWAGPWGGNPQCQTPNLDRFADQGAVVFTNTHCAGPVCGPSRSAIMSGFMPYTTGAYTNGSNMLLSPVVQTHATMPEYFTKNGYITISSGKIFHAHRGENGFDRGQWSFDVWEQAGGGWDVDQSTLFSRRKGIINGVKQENPKYADPHGSEFGWAATIRPTEETSDYMTAQWAASKLSQTYDKPFFLAVGIFRPHLPWYVPKEFYDKYDLDSIELPEVDENDFDDILKPNGEPKFKPSSDYLWCSEDEFVFKSAVRAYMACVTYADYCLGVIMDALENSPHKDNTIVIIWGDHGWHLGEKMRFRKATIWSEATRAPMLARLPGMTDRHVNPSPVNLNDMYPTLVELCGLPEKKIDGRSFAPLLKKPETIWETPTVTIKGPESASVRGLKWRYARYEDGTEELYNLESDPLERENLVHSEDQEAIVAKKRLMYHFPTVWAPAVGKVKQKEGVDRRKPDLTIKATRNLAALK